MVVGTKMLIISKLVKPTRVRTVSKYVEKSGIGDHLKIKQYLIHPFQYFTGKQAIILRLEKCTGINCANKLMGTIVRYVRNHWTVVCHADFWYKCSTSFVLIKWRGHPETGDTSSSSPTLLRWWWGTRRWGWPRRGRARVEEARVEEALLLGAEVVLLVLLHSREEWKCEDDKYLYLHNTNVCVNALFLRLRKFYRA